MRIGLVVVAGGRGERFGGPPKQWRQIAGRSLVSHALERIGESRAEALPVLVHRPEDRDLAAASCRAGTRLVEGGSTRRESVWAGLEALASEAPDLVLIHDAARPCVPPALGARVLAALETHDGAAPALPVTDALWRGAGLVEGTVPRDGLWRAQTPQGFRFDAILAAHRAHVGDATDDVEVARAAGLRVAIVAGEEENLKVTTAPDLERARTILEGRVDIRLGNGFDVHAFGEGDHVTLCGVQVPHGQGLTGHSDADVGLHALTDAILGALALGDIGRHFPPSDPQWRGADSRVFLRHAVALARDAGFTLSNADVTLICEFPKIGPHAEAMRATTAETLGIETGRVSVKATTSERLGFTGRGEGIAAIATATLVRS